MARKTGKKKGAVVVDGVDTTPMSREQLEQFALRLKEQLDKEREERNYFQLERDKIRTFWEITRQQLEECRAELRNKDSVMGLEEERHQTQEKLFKQKTKHLLYEHQTNIADLRTQGMLSLKLAQEDFEEQEGALVSDKKDLKEKLLEQQKEHQEEVRALRMQFSEELSKSRQDFQVEAQEITEKYEAKIDTLRIELSLRHNMELTEVDERKNKHITDLMHHHDKKFSDMKNYYNDITFNNLALISSLKEQMEEMKTKEERTERALKEALKENRALTGPAKQAIAERAELKRQLANYERDKVALAYTRRKLAAAENDFRDLRSEHDVLEMILDKVETERKELQSQLAGSVMEVQQAAGLKTIMLDKKLRALLDLLDQREIQFAETLMSLKVDSKSLSVANRKVELMVRRKNAAIQDLEYELARVCKAHDDLLKTYEGKLIQYGIPKEELGFTPLTSGVATAKGPAGLVTLNK